jgi:hypothetical protein
MTMSSPDPTETSRPAAVVKLKRGINVPADALEQMERAAQRQGSDFTRAELTQVTSTPPESPQLAPTQAEPAPVASTPSKSSRVKATRIESTPAEPVQPAVAQGRAGVLRGERLQAYVDAETYAAVQARAIELERSDSWVAAQLITAGIKALKAK